MSCPRCRWASKMSVSSGSRRRSSPSQVATSSSALLRASIGGRLVRVRAMTDVLMYADTFRSPELRHEVPLGVPDPFLYVEKDGVKHISIGSMEIPRLAALGLFELHPSEEYGLDDLIAEGKSYAEVRHEIPLRAVKALGVTKAVVPEAFPLWLADELRANGVELTVDGEFFDDRRRVKTQSQLAGMRRAQRAAEAGMDTARDLLRRAEQNGAG